jgi:very-short-patch-repair endonuclease
MSYLEALKDGIKTFEKYGNTNYYVKCVTCGSEFTTMNYKSNYVYKCQDCRQAEKEQGTERQHDIKLKKFDKALDRIKKQGNDIDIYKQAIAIIKPLLENRNWFQSTEEIMVGLELAKKKVKFNHQVKVGRYVVDFILPDEKIAIEVDGSVFHNQLTLEKEKYRDKMIIVSLGADWEIIRIKDTYINQNISKFVPAIKAVAKKRKQYRLSHNGQLPKKYNEHCV